MSDNEISRDEKEEIVEVAAKYGEYLSENAPQLDGNNLNYYFAGSLASMLYANANQIEYCDLIGNEVVKVNTPKKISEESRNDLKVFARKIGDIDIVQVGSKGLIQDLEQPIHESGLSFPITDNYPYIVQERYIKNQIPNINKLHSKTQISALFGDDALRGELNDGVTKDRVCRLTTVSGKTIYVASPETIIAQKLDKTFKYYGTEFEEKKDVRDLALFINGISKSYDENELNKKIAEAWLEKKENMQVNEKDIPRIKNKMTRMYNNDMKAIMNNEGYYDLTKLQKIFGGSIGIYVEKRLELLKRIEDSAKKIACSNKLENVNKTQREIKDNVQERKNQTKETISGAYINECGEIIRPKNNDSVGGNDGNR